MKKMKIIISLFTILSLFSSVVDAQNWQYLIGDNLENWQQLGGKATYELQDKTIIGKTVSSTPNSFLTTKKHYSDFILEYEVWLDPTVNSGVQVRSNSKADYRKGTVHGYQIELDPSARAYSGGVYDESRRAWLYPLSRNEKGEKGFSERAMEYIQGRSHWQSYSNVGEWRAMRQFGGRPHGFGFYRFAGA